MNLAIPTSGPGPWRGVIKTYPDLVIENYAIFEKSVGDSDGSKPILGIIPIQWVEGVNNACQSEIFILLNPIFDKQSNMFRISFLLWESVYHPSIDSDLVAEESCTVRVYITLDDVLESAATLVGPDEFVNIKEIKKLFPHLMVAETEAFHIFK